MEFKTHEFSKTGNRESAKEDHNYFVMDLTPVRIRGKKRSAKNADLRDITSPKADLQRDVKGKRPLRLVQKPPISSHLPSTGSIGHSCTKGRLKTGRHISTLENLPVELLETIFFLSLNISLPQASNIIGQALASKHVKAQLVYRYFSTNFSEAAYVDLQSAILRTRWMTLAFLRELPDYTTLIFTRELSEHSIMWDGAQGFQIPEKLLHGPWTDERCEFLEIVERGNGTVDWLGSTSGEIAARGLEDAIRERNCRAIKALVGRRGDWVQGGGAGVVPRQYHLKMALLQEGDSTDIVEELFWAARIDFNVEPHAILDTVMQSVRQEGLRNEEAENMEQSRMEWLQGMMHMRDSL